ncbi:magnesium transporter [uncultured Fenollaria sp.]|uniref:magnesium transporter n=1 Tax=uncultured Fenollaria sp. TaxID=1686315 RepID=UPI0025D9F3DC|nr:magnesium transporter [uncultured Fenollaria sp.]
MDNDRREVELEEDKIEILDLYKGKKPKALIQKLSNMNAADVAEILDELEVTDATVIFRLLPKDQAVDVFTYFDSEQQQDIIATSTDADVEYILKEIFFDDKIDMLEEMPANIVDKILEKSSPSERKLINQFLNYPEDSAGSIMTIEYCSVKKTLTVKEAMERLKKVGLQRETIYTIYVIDANRKLEGIVSLRDLVIADDDTVIGDIMNRDVVYVNVYEDQEVVAGVIQKYDFVAVPVVDNEERIVGIITVDDVIDIIEQEATEDFQKMAALSPSEEEYLDTPAFTLAKHRIAWLLFLMISATLTGSILQRFEDYIAAIPALLIFIPMLMDTGGNAGSQSATLVIRGLAVGEIEPKDAFKVLWKEFQVSILVGLALSLVNFGRIRLLHPDQDPKIAITVSISVMFTVMLAKLVGGLLPIGAKKIKLDPAIMASPLITTIVDATSLLVYFAVARIMLGI